MALSRQMEFHADAIAASVAGSEVAAGALRKIQAGGICYNHTINFCNQLAPMGFKPANIYMGMHVMMEGFAKENDLELNNGVPVLTDAALESEVKFDNQWQSHPALPDREQSIALLNFTGQPDTRSAWVLIKDAEALQIKVTANMYSHNEKNKALKSIGQEEFAAKLTAQQQAAGFPDLFGHYYDYRHIEKFEAGTTTSTTLPHKLSDVLTNEASINAKSFRNGSNNVTVVENISTGAIDTESFDYHGRRYTRQEAAQLVKEIKNQNKDLAAQLLERDKLIFAMALRQSNAEQQHNLKAALNDYYSAHTEFDQFIALYNEAMPGLAPIFNGQSFKYEFLQHLFDDFRHNAGLRIKAVAQNCISRNAYDNDWVKDPELKKNAAALANNSYVYYNNKVFHNEQLRVLNRFMNSQLTFVQVQLFQTKKHLLTLQAESLKAPA